MLNTIVAHDTDSRHFDFSDLTSDERAELKAWIDATTSEITDAELNEMYRRDQEYQRSLYELAKAKFETLHPFSRPDSLTRRGNVLIARRRLTIDAARNGARDDFWETIEYLFDGRVTIHSIDIDCKYNLRVRFTPHSLIKLHDGSHCIGDHSNVDWFRCPSPMSSELGHRESSTEGSGLSWCAERNQGGY